MNFPRVHRSVSMGVVKVDVAITNFVRCLGRLPCHGPEAHLPRADRRSTRGEQHGEDAVNGDNASICSCRYQVCTRHRSVKFSAPIYHVASKEGDNVRSRVVSNACNRCVFHVNQEDSFFPFVRAKVSNATCRRGPFLYYVQDEDNRREDVPVRLAVYVVVGQVIG